MAATSTCGLSPTSYYGDRSMRRFHPLVACVLAAAALRVGAVPATARTSSRRPSAPPKPPPGWVVDRLRFEPLDPSQGPVGVDGLGDYRGAIELRPSAGGVAVVNDVALDDYLRGISEVPSNWPPAALEAQAIAARTYALYQLAQAVPTAATAVGAQICATDACQVYAGLAKERAPNGADWSAAVDRTAGQAVLDRGQPILAMYSSSNGGRSVAGSKPYLRAIDDPDDARSPLSKWRTTVAFNDLQGAFSLPGPVTGLTRTGDSIDIAYNGA